MAAGTLARCEQSDVVAPRLERKKVELLWSLGLNASG